MGNHAELAGSSKGARVFRLGCAYDSWIGYFHYRVVIALTMRQHAPSVITDLGFFSSPEHSESYLIYPSPDNQQDT